jgi:hypothetical protein
MSSTLTQVERLARVGMTGSRQNEHNPRLERMVNNIEPQLYVRREERIKRVEEQKKEQTPKQSFIKKLRMRLKKR